MSDENEIHKAVELFFDAHKDEAGRFWTVFWAMSATNLAVLGFLVEKQTDADQRPTTRTIAVLVPLLGFLISAVWFRIQIRLRGWCDWWDENLGKAGARWLEKVNEGACQEQKVSIFPDCTNRLDPLWLSAFKGAKWFALAVPVLFVVAWIVVFFLVLE